MEKLTESRVKKRKDKSLCSAYFKALRKWLKVIFQHYEDLKTDINEQDKRIEELENTVRLIRLKLKSIDNGEVNGR